MREALKVLSVVVLLFAAPAAAVAWFDNREETGKKRAATHRRVSEFSSFSAMFSQLQCFGGWRNHPPKLFTTPGYLTADRLCKVGNDHALRALVLVEPADQRLIRPDSPARIHVHGGGSHHFSGSVSDIAQVDAKSIPAQLSNRVGGNVATQQDPVTKAEKPHSQHYLVAIRIHEGDPRLHPGVLANVKIETASQTLWWRCRRFLGSAFSSGL